MDERPVVQPLLRAEHQDAEHLGPISPELALVDPLLAARARELLPDPGAFFRPPPVVVEEKRPSVLVPLEPRPRRRWPRTAALAVLVFAVGAVAGGVLRDRHRAQSGALELRTVTLPTTGQRVRGGRPPSATHKEARRASARTAQRVPLRTWAVNVLGVAAQVSGPRVSLVWQRPVGSAHVVVLRALGDRRQETVVFRGRATTFRDEPPRPCTAYRYTIVNFDRHGHRSTGVPTSVVTGGCT